MLTRYFWRVFGVLLIGAACASCGSGEVFEASCHAELDPPNSDIKLAIDRVAVTNQQDGIGVDEVTAVVVVDRGSETLMGGEEATTARDCQLARLSGGEEQEFENGVIVVGLSREALQVDPARLILTFEESDKGLLNNIYSAVVNAIFGLAQGLLDSTRLGSSIDGAFGTNVDQLFDGMADALRNDDDQIGSPMVVGVFRPPDCDGAMAAVLRTDNGLSYANDWSLTLQDFYGAEWEIDMSLVDSTTGDLLDVVDDQCRPVKPLPAEVLKEADPGVVDRTIHGIGDGIKSGWDWVTPD